MKKRILVIINSDHFVRNYITTHAFREIEKDFHCSYLLSEKIRNLDAFDVKNSFSRYATDKLMESRHYTLFNVLMWKFKKKSPSFKFRILRTIGFRSFFCFPQTYGLLQKIIRVPWQLFRWMMSNAYFYIVCSWPIYPLYLIHYKNSLAINAALEMEIKKAAPDLILFPTSAYDPDGTDTVRICEKLRIPVLFLVDNWDNLSSKSILWAKPPYIGVWGKQSAEHAVTIQGFLDEQVTCLGTPRFDQYFRVRDLDLKSNFDFKYILFVGTSLTFDEATVLTELNKIISRNATIFNNVKIVYRPHPWRQGHDSIVGKKMEHVIVDPQMLNAYSKKDSSKDVQPDLSYYPSLLKNAEFVIGGLTSMLIEALIFRRRFMALVYDDGVNFTSQHNAFKYYTHFQGLRAVEAISFCESFDALEGVFIDTWLARDSVDTEEVDLQRKYFYFDDLRSYGQRLRDLCGDITDGAT